MSDHFGMPGPGGSLGTCAVCGKPFLKEILLGERTVAFDVKGCAQTLHAHADTCAPMLKKVKRFDELPADSPLRKAWEKQQPQYAQR